MKITRRQLRQIISESLLLAEGANVNPSWNLYVATTDAWESLKNESSPLASSVYEVYSDINGAVQSFAVSYSTRDKINTLNVNKRIDRAISELEKIRSFATKRPEEIALITGDSAFDASNAAATAAATAVDTANISYKTGTGAGFGDANSEPNSASVANTKDEQ